MNKYFNMQTHFLDTQLTLKLNQMEVVVTVTLDTNLYQQQQFHQL